MRYHYSVRKNHGCVSVAYQLYKALSLSDLESHTCCKASRKVVIGPILCTRKLRIREVKEFVLCPNDSQTQICSPACIWVPPVTLLKSYQKTRLALAFLQNWRSWAVLPAVPFSCLWIPCLPNVNPTPSTPIKSIWLCPPTHLSSQPTGGQVSW